MRIGIIPALHPSQGGTYQYSMTMLHTLCEWKDTACEDEFIVFGRQIPDTILASVNGRNWTFKPLPPEQPPSLQHKILEGLRGFVGEGRIGRHGGGCEENCIPVRNTVIRM